MSDEDRPMFTAPVAAIPSRKASEPLPPLPDKPVRERLPPREIARITVNRKKNMKKAKRGRPATVKSPNRPLEMKNQLAAVLQIATRLTREELGGFMKAMELMGSLSRTSRKRVLAALEQVWSAQ